MGEAAERVDALANGLLALGIRKGDTIAILGSTRLEWALFDFAAACVGAITAAIYQNSSPKDCHYILEHSEAIGVLVEDDADRAKLEGGPQLRHVLTFAGLDELAEQGRAYAAEHPDELDEAVAAIRRGRRLHLHLHLGDDRPAEGLHDLAPATTTRWSPSPTISPTSRFPATRCCCSCRWRTTSAG